jgi:O-acetylhomoserine/O-acetylserine sulfhydrylase-like pyridoxal-dependent enzyme
MPGSSDPAFDTLALHAGAAPDPATGARAVPIHLSTSFVFESSDHAASLFNMERSGHVYSRISNPTNAVLEERVAALEGGAGAIATASGQAALHLAVATLAGAGHHIVASSALYGGSHNLLHYTLRRFGIETSFVKPGDIDGWRAAIRPETRLLFGETLGNPGLDVLDIRAAAAGGQHLHHAVADEALRTWRRPNLSFGHQVPVRPRYRGGWRAGGQRPVRLGQVGPLPRAERALCRLPWHGVQRREHGWRLPAARAP